METVTKPAAMKAAVLQLVDKPAIAALASEARQRLERVMVAV